jgi:hypothetical protein
MSSPVQTTPYGLEEPVRSEKLPQGVEQPTGNASPKWLAVYFHDSNLVPDCVNVSGASIQSKI